MKENIYTSSCQSFRLRLPCNIYEKIASECTKSGDFETGGILVGYYSLDLKEVVITLATMPGMDSKKGKSTFHRGTKGLIKKLDGAWSEEEYYVGEWHYHPNHSSNPSHVDINQMKQLSSSNKLKCPEPVLLVFGGKDNSTWETSAIIIKNDVVIPLFYDDTCMSK